MRRLLIVPAIVSLIAASGSLAAPCKDAAGKFIKCPPVKAAAVRCRAAGKFVKCGTPGAKPA